MAEYQAPAPVREDIRVERLRECLAYDPETGILCWKIKVTTNVAVGDVAGCLDYRGYRFVRLDNRLMTGHRIAWAIYHGSWPERDIDHKNRDKSDNRIENLRVASRTNNIANSPSRSSKGLPKGCYRLKGHRRWYSQIRANGKIKRLGTFDTAEEAAAAFEREHRVANGEFSCCEAR